MSLSLREQLDRDANAPNWATTVTLIGLGVFALISLGSTVTFALETDTPLIMAVSANLALQALGFGGLMFTVLMYRAVAPNAGDRRLRKYASILWLRKFQPEGHGNHEISVIVDNMQEHGIQVFCLADKGYFFSHIEAERILNKRKFAAIELLGPLAIPANHVIDSASAFGADNRASHFNTKQRFASLEDISKKLLKKVRLPNSSIFRTDDDIWQDAVQLMVDNTDVVVIDISSPTDNIAWEIGQSVERNGIGRVVFLVEDKAFFDSDRLAAIHDLLTPIVGDQRIALFEYSSESYTNPTVSGQSGQLARFILDAIDGIIETVAVPGRDDLRTIEVDTLSPREQRMTRRRRRG